MTAQIADKLLYWTMAGGLVMFFIIGCIARIERKDEREGSGNDGEQNH